MYQWMVLMMMMMWESHKGYFGGDVVIEVGTLVVLRLIFETHDMIGYEKR
jgi:hypothetical protein